MVSSAVGQLGPELSPKAESNDKWGEGPTGKPLGRTISSMDLCSHHYKKDPGSPFISRPYVKFLLYDVLHPPPPRSFKIKAGHLSTRFSVIIGAIYHSWFAGERWHWYLLVLQVLTLYVLVFPSLMCIILQRDHSNKIGSMLQHHLLRCCEWWSGFKLGLLHLAVTLFLLFPAMVSLSQPLFSVLLRQELSWKS